MPAPKKGEQKKDYMKRCIPQIIKEGNGKGIKQPQAYAICESLWENRRGGSKDVRIV